MERLEKFYRKSGLRKAHVEYPLSEAEMVEWIKCKKDIFYFIESYCKLKLYKHQIDVLKDTDENRLNIIIQSRQTGITTLLNFIILHKLLFSNNTNVLLVDFNKEVVKNRLDIILRILAELPYFLQVGVISKNKKGIKFDNGCIIDIKSSRNKKIGIGKNYDYMDLHNFAYYPKNSVEKLWNNLYPNISAIQDTKLIISSTPNGNNKFYKLYQDAVDDKNVFNPIRIDWYVVPGRDESWKNEQIRILGEDVFNREYLLKFKEN